MKTWLDAKYSEEDVKYKRNEEFEQRTTLRTSWYSQQKAQKLSQREEVRGMARRRQKR